MARTTRRVPLDDLAAALRAGAIDPRRFLRDPRAGARALARRWLRVRRRAEAERRRVARLFAVEREAWAEGIRLVAGVDEVGRGAIAGPVVAAAVMFSEECFIRLLRDSKQLRPQERDDAYAAIVASGARWSVGVAEVEEIERLNLMGATRLAWQRALDGLRPPPDLVLLDGNIPAHVRLPQRILVKGDARCACIAAASIVAKVTRDRVMLALDRRYPGYGFAAHKGYRTRAHWRALRQYGPSPAHRWRYLPADLRQVPLALG